MGWRGRWLGSADHVTTGAGRPSRKPMMLSTGRLRERSLASSVTPPRCGVITTLSRSLNGFCSSGSGSVR
jgi:hypothetical protein